MPGRARQDGPVLVIAPSYAVAARAARRYELGEPGRGWRFVATMRDVQGQAPGGRYLYVEDERVQRSAMRDDVIRDALAALNALGWHNIA